MTKKNAELTKMDFVCALLKAHAKGKNTPVTGLKAVMLAHTVLGSIVEKYDTLNEAFNKVGMDQPWGECPTCGTPVLLEMGRCPVSGTVLTMGEAVETEAVAEEETEVEEKPAKKAAKKKASKKASKKKEPEPVEEELEDEVEEELEDGEEYEEEELPTYEEILKMKKKELVELIEEYELDVEVEEYKKIKDLREAVNEAFEDMAGEEIEGEEIEGEADTLEDDEDETETEEESEESEEEDDFDLDDVDLDDLDDLDGIEDEDFED